MLLRVGVLSRVRVLPRVRVLSRMRSVGVLLRMVRRSVGMRTMRIGVLVRMGMRVLSRVSRMGMLSRRHVIILGVAAIVVRIATIRLPRARPRRLSYNFIIGRGIFEVAILVVAAENDIQRHSFQYLAMSMVKTIRTMSRPGVG